MPIFLVGKYARHKDRDEVIHQVGIVSGDDVEREKIRALAELYEDCPIIDDWINHDIVVSEIDREYILGFTKRKKW